jgi:hypothetical protein
MKHDPIEPELVPAIGDSFVKITLVVIALVVGFSFGWCAMSNAAVGDKIDLTQYNMTFNEDFSRPLANTILPGYGWGTLTSPTTPTAPWTLFPHTEWDGGSFGYAYFTGQAEATYDANGKLIGAGDSLDKEPYHAVPPNPFSYTPYKRWLNITAYNDSNICHWRTGFVATVDTAGNGFHQSLGSSPSIYFEVSANLPPGCPPGSPSDGSGLGGGVWPAITLQSIPPGGFRVPRTTNECEIDIMEMYGVDMTQLHQRAHAFSPSGQELLPPGSGNTITIANPSGAFHRFGVLIDAQVTHFTYDGVVTFEMPTDQTFLHPLFPTVDLALGGGWPINITMGRMEVQYIRAYQHK